MYLTKSKTLFDYLTNVFDNEFFIDDFYQKNLNWKRTDNNFFIEIPLVGFDKNDVKISIKNNILNISAIKKDIEDKTYNYQGFKIDSIERRFKLPNDLKIEKYSAHLRHGILTINIEFKNDSENELLINID